MMGNIKVNLKFHIKSKRAFICIAVIVFALAFLLYLMPSDTQSNSDSALPAYIGNKATKTVHYPDCRYVSQISEKNVLRFSSFSEAEGFKACSICNPK
jgi:hypothetical protein